ncbi:DNA damage-inducible transcript 4 protein-like [Osmerus eperlanus]|uniref:DNA damage-inducible transcript 4 protein-like n=1 Tax=Osmerus eperlanus TaxID=29151 RepID=UPI002E155D90
MPCNNSVDESYPPSPPDYVRGCKRLSWGNLEQRLTEIKISQSLTSDQYSMNENGSVSDMSLTSESSMFCEPLEETLCAQVVETIAQKLTDPSDNVLRCSKIILPDLLLQNIRQKLLHLAAAEPCGLRGALIDLCLAQGDQKSLCSVDRLAVEPSLVPTFHLTLVLRPDTGGLWPKFQKLFRGIYSPPKHRTTMNHRHSLRLSTSFMAIKRKLYSSEELLVEEC